MMKNFAAALLGSIALWAPLPASAGVFVDGDLIMVQGAPNAIHYNKSPDHVQYSWLLGAEWQSPDRWLAGVSRFENSFGQSCEYVYGGYVWPIAAIDPRVYVKLAVGIIFGYKEPYENKIPFNNNGVAFPIPLPAIGFKQDRWNVQLNILGSAGLMITVGYDVFR
jgi:hypothetical protein